MAFVAESAAMQREMQTPIEKVLLVDDNKQSLLALEAILEGSDRRDRLRCSYQSNSARTSRN